MATHEGLLAQGTAELRAAAIELPRFEAELLLAAATGLPRESLIAQPAAAVLPAHAAAFRCALVRRAGHEPLAYITGRKEFMSLDLAVTQDVLVPRPDSELLVEQALAFLAPMAVAATAISSARPDGPVPTVIDVGTGSGAIALAVAHYEPAARVWAVDISPAAAKLARRNAAALSLAERVTVITGNLLQAADLPAAGTVDLVLANLPYVRAEAFATLAPEVAIFEPRLALDGGSDGLSLIRQLVPQAAAALSSRGGLGLECDPAQCTLVSQMLLEAGFRKTMIRPDLAGLARTVWGFKDGQANPG